MKTIGLLGGTGWSSTIGYYKILNEMVHQRLGGYHSAKILLKSIDYHNIKSNYGKDNEKVAQLLYQELSELIALKPHCVILCCNTLHKYYDLIKDQISSDIPVMHALDLITHHMVQNGYKSALLLATEFTMDDGFFAKKLESAGMSIVLPNSNERSSMSKIHKELIQGVVTQESKNHFKNLIGKYDDLDAVILGCTEYSLVVDQENSVVSVINPVYLQAKSAVDYALNG